jgi:hypothetical protein
MTQTSHVALPPHAPHVLQAWSKLESNEAHYTLKAETVFRPYHASHCGGVTQESQVVLPSYVAQRVQARSKSGSNEENFTLEAETLSHPYLASHYSRLTVHSLSLRDTQCNFVRHRAVTKGTLLLKPKQFIVPISPPLIARIIKLHTWHSLNMLHNQCQFG